jgi:hypothetical protein
VYGAKSTTPTDYDSPVKTPTNDDTNHYEPPKVVTKDAYPQGSYEDDREENHAGYETYDKDKPHFEDSEFDFNRANGLTA